MLNSNSKVSDIETKISELKKLLTQNGYKVSNFVPASICIDQGYIVIDLKPEISFEIKSPN